MISFSFRPATFEDAPLLYECRNDPLSRSMSFHSEEISYETHLNWLKKSLSSSTRELYIFLSHTNNSLKAIGVLRRDLQGSTYELSWSLVPSARSQGYGKIMLIEFLKQFPASYIAKIKKENIASQKICEAAGFHLEQESLSILYYGY